MDNSIGDKSAYPVDADQYGGMTYRQWLIGKILSGCALSNVIIPEIYAERAIKLADLVIEQLDKED